MSWNIKKPKKWYDHWLLWTVLILGVATFFGWRKANNRYQQWRAGRQVRHAAECIAQGDFRRAMLDARSALQANPMNAEAIQIMAKALEGVGSAATAAQWRSLLDSVAPGDPENILAWASDSLKAGDLGATERILAMLKPEPKDNATYHATAASVAAAKRDTATAKQHWAEAARIDPKEDRYRLNLAILRLGSKSGELRAGAVDILMKLSRKPSKSAEALRVLLADATKCRDWGRAFEFANALVADPRGTFPDKLTRLATLRAMKAGQATAYLTELRDEAVAKPEDLYLLLMWMNQHDLALLVSEWSRTLPQDVIGVPPASVAVADAHVRSADWPRLREFLNAHSWAEWDYLRRAFLARALEASGDAEQAAQEWKDGIAAARSRADARERLERMVRLVIGWGWEQRAQEVMWIMANSPNCPRWMLDALWLIAQENTDTAQLQKLASLLAKADAKSTVLRNNHAFFSLLIRSEDGSPHREAEKLFAENPSDSAIAVTRGLSLYQQGKVSEAVAVTGSLSPEELRKPQIALYHAIFLTAAGEGAKAGEFLTLAQGRKMFPEEKTLLERARHAVAKAADERSIAEAAKVARDARAARDAEADKAVDLARAARAAQATKDAAQAAR